MYRAPKAKSVSHDRLKLELPDSVTWLHGATGAGIPRLGRFAGWLAGWLAGWQAGWLVGLDAGHRSGRLLVGWLNGYCEFVLKHNE